MLTHVPPPNPENLAVDRLARLREQLQTRGADAAILTTPESVLYATGHRSLNATMFPAVALGAYVTQDEVIAILPAGEIGPASRLTDTITDIVTVGGAFLIHPDGSAIPGQVPDFAAAIQRVTAGRTHQALVLEGAVPTDALRCSHDEIVDGAAFMADVRAVKLPDEIALLRASAEITEAAIEAGIAAITPGISERELARVVAATMVEHGADPRFLVVATGMNAADSDAFPTDLECREGDLVRFDVGCVYGGYWSDIARTAVIGTPTSKQQRLYDAMLAGVEAEFHAAREGAPANDVFTAGIAAAEATAGISQYHRHHLGHTIGLSIYEKPLITPDDRSELRTGMTFCLETPYYERGWGGLIVEDTGVITDNGFELFTTIDRNLRVIS